jgi:hypothetical protein
MNLDIFYHGETTQPPNEFNIIDNFMILSL